MVGVFYLIVLIADVYGSWKIVQKVMQAFAFFLKNLIHIFGGGDVLNRPVEIGVFFDFFDRIGPFKDICFL